MFQDETKNQIEKFRQDSNKRVCDIQMDKQDNYKIYWEWGDIEEIFKGDTRGFNGREGGFLA